jgi:PAS domain S-box-containing protein
LPRSRTRYIDETPQHLRCRVIVWDEHAGVTKNFMDRRTDDLHYRLLFESAPDAILVVDSGGVIQLNNVQAEKLLEASPGELLGMNVDKLVPLAVRRKHVNLRNSFAKTTNSRPMGAGLALHAVKLTGREFPVEISLSSAERAGYRETIVVMRDVSERLAARRTETELRRARTLTTITELALRERDFQRLSDQVVKTLLEPLGADAVSILDSLSGDTKYTLRAVAGDSSEAVQSLLEVGLELPNARRYPILVGDDTKSETPLFPLGAPLGFKSYISVPLHQNGVAVGVLTMASRTPHRFSGEDLTFFEAVTNVISTALERSGAEEKLMDSLRLESLGQLTGGIAHDFNNLLTVISGNLQLLELPGIDDKEKARAIAASQRAARSGADLTAKLLAYSRRQTLRPTHVDIEKLLVSFQELLLRTLGAGVQIELTISPELPFALVDAGQLESALLNLVVNARDAMPDGGHLKISASFAFIDSDSSGPTDGQLKAGGYIKISIADDGTGMSQATTDRVFEPFFTTKPVGKGSGLGLSMVYGFAKQSAGHVAVQSALGSGTCFDLFIPVLPDLPNRNPLPKDSALHRGHGERVLIVEDDEAVLNVANQFFRALGYETTSATTQAEAIMCLQEHDDTVLVFSDVILGGYETGPQVCAALLALKPTLRILLTSGYARANLQSQLSVNDKVELLRKPYSIEALAAAIKRALD